MITVFKFEIEQEVYEIAGVKVGGQPGQLPTVMIGSIFYDGHAVVKDEKTGEFDIERAQELLKMEEEVSDRTGNPRIVDVCCSWPNAFEKYIDFVADNIEGPFAIDGTTAQVKMAGARYALEVGLSDRVVYNSIMPHAKEEEISAIKETKIDSAILLALNTRNPTIHGRLQVIEELMSKTQDARIKKPLIDTTVLDIPDIGPISKTIYLAKKKHGIPAGAGAHNAVARWVEKCEVDSIQNLHANIVANVFPIVLGADFLLYGPIENAPNAYFHCSLADAYIAYSMKQEFRMRPLTTDHPLLKIFRSEES